MTKKLSMNLTERGAPAARCLLPTRNSQIGSDLRAWGSIRNIERISVSDAYRERREGLVRDRNTPQKVVFGGRGSFWEQRLG
jgi:hypothetical protein